ncbi:MAG: hypothetical protein RR394_07830 [Oscillospiraceae bacterium]
MNTEQNTEQPMKTICEADAYGATLLIARRLTEAEKLRYAEWFQKLGFVGMNHEQKITLEYVKWSDMPNRPYDGSFCGCSERIWIISEDEWNEYVSLNERRAKEHADEEREKNISALTAKKEYMEVLMEALKELPTKKEAAQLAKRYNDFNNEGGDGFVPHFYSKEEYAETCEELSKLLTETRTS